MEITNDTIYLAKTDMLCHIACLLRRNAIILSSKYKRQFAFDITQTCNSSYSITFYIQSHNQNH